MSEAMDGMIANIKDEINKTTYHCKKCNEDHVFGSEIGQKHFTRKNIREIIKNSGLKKTLKTVFPKGGAQ